LPPAAAVRTLVAAIATITIVGLGLTLTIPLLSLKMTEAGYSAGFIGLNTAVGGLTSIFCAPLVPLVARRIGMRRLLLIALLFGAPVLIGFAATDHVVVWLALRFLFQFTLTTAFVLSEYWINAAAPPDRRGLVMGIYATSLCLGFAAGPVLLGLTESGGSLPFVLGAAVFICAAVPVAAAGDTAPVIDEHPTASPLSFLTRAPAATLAALVFGAVETGAMALLPVYGLFNQHSERRAALLVTFFSLGNVLFQVPLGMLSDRINRQKMLLTIAVIGAFGALIMPLVADSFVLLSMLLLVWGGLIGGCYPIGLAHLGSRFSGVDLASANAAFIMFYSLGMLTGPPFLGAAMDVSRPHGLASAIGLLFSLYGSLVLWRLTMRAP